MSTTNLIKHRAIISHIHNKRLVAQLHPDSACSCCSVRQTCSLSSQSAKIVEINVHNPTDYHLGEEIIIAMTQKNGFVAVFYAYLLPLLLILSTLFLTKYYTDNEVTAGIFSIIILFPYYLALFLLQKYFLQKFDFKIIEK